MIGTATNRGQRAAKARMKSTATVRRKTGATTTNADGFKVPVWAVVATSAPFRLGGSSSGDGGSHAVTVGGVAFETATGVGSFIHDQPLEDNDYVEVTAGEWVGEVVRVVKAIAADQKTARRVPVESVARPTEWGP